MSDVVSLNAQNHKVKGDTDETVCGLTIPEGTGELEGTDPCPVCFGAPKKRGRPPKGKVI